MNDARNADVALFRYSLIREAADESLTTRQERGAGARAAPRPVPMLVRTVGTSPSPGGPSTGGSGPIGMGGSTPLARVPRLGEPTTPVALPRAGSP